MVNEGRTIVTYCRHILSTRDHTINSAGYENVENLRIKTLDVSCCQSCLNESYALKKENLRGKKKKRVKRQKDCWDQYVDV